MMVSGMLASTTLSRENLGSQKMEVEQGDQQDGESYKTMMKMVIMMVVDRVMMTQKMIMMKWRFKIVFFSNKTAITPSRLNAVL